MNNLRTFSLSSTAVMLGAPLLSSCGGSDPLVTFKNQKMVSARLKRANASTAPTVPLFNEPIAAGKLIAQMQEINNCNR